MGYRFVDEEVAPTQAAEQPQRKRYRFVDEEVAPTSAPAAIEPPPTILDPEKIVPRWGRENPNLYGVVGGIREIGRFAGLGQIGTAIGKEAAYWMQEGLTPEQSAAAGLTPTTGERVGAGLQAAALALPIGKVAGLGEKVAAKVLAPTAAKLAGGAAAGAGAGYLYEAGEKAAEGKTVGEVITPGGMTLAGAVIPPAITGAAFGIPKVAAAIGRTIPTLTNKGIEREAASKLAAALPLSSLDPQHIAHTVALESKVPGLKFTTGQLTDEAAVNSLQKILSKEGIVANQLSEGQWVAGQKAVQDYYKKQLIASPQGTGEIFANLSSADVAIKDNLTRATIKLEEEAAKLAKTPGQEATGEAIRAQLQVAKDFAEASFEERYAGIPNLPVESDSMRRDINRLKSLMEKEGYEGHPQLNSIIRNIEERTPQVFETKTIAGNRTAMETYMGQSPKERTVEVAKGFAPIKFQELKGMNTTLNELGRDLNNPINPQRVAGRYVSELQDIVQSAMSKIDTMAGGAGGKYRKIASDYAEYDKTFRRGRVGEILRKGEEASGYRLATEDIARKVFMSKNFKAADDLVRAIGKDAASKAVKDVAAQDLLYAITDKETQKVVGSKLAGWVKKNEAILKKHGLENDFKNISTAQKAVDNAVAMSDDFNASVAGRILKADPDIAIERVFAGTAKLNKAAAASELMAKLGNDKAAIKGTQNAFASWLKDKALLGDDIVAEGGIVSAYGKLGGLLDDYDSAIKVIYKDSPDKITALKTVHNALGVLSRSAKMQPLTAGVTDITANIASGVASKAVQNSFRGRMVRSVFKNFKDISNEAVDALLTKAMFDPTYAEALLKIHKGNVDNATKSIVNRIFPKSAAAIDRAVAYGKKDIANLGSATTYPTRAPGDIIYEGIESRLRKKPSTIPPPPTGGGAPPTTPPPMPPRPVGGGAPPSPIPIRQGIGAPSAPPPVRPVVGQPMSAYAPPLAPPYAPQGIGAPVRRATGMQPAPTDVSLPPAEIMPPSPTEQYIAGGGKPLRLPAPQPVARQSLALQTGEVPPAASQGIGAMIPKAPAPSGVKEVMAVAMEDISRRGGQPTPETLRLTLFKLRDEGKIQISPEMQSLIEQRDSKGGLFNKAWENLYETRSKLINEKINEGATVVVGEEGRRLQSPDGSYLTEKEISKAAMSNAAYLIESKKEIAPGIKASVKTQGEGIDNLGSLSYVEAKKRPDGVWQLYYRGTRNEVFPGEKFKSAHEARGYFKAMNTKPVAASPQEGIGALPPQTAPITHEMSSPIGTLPKGTESWYANRWDSAKIGDRAHITLQGKWITNKNKMSKTGEKISMSKWDDLSPAAKNIIRKELDKYYGIIK